MNLSIPQIKLKLYSLFGYSGILASLTGFTVFDVIKLIYSFNESSYNNWRDFAKENLIQIIITISLILLLISAYYFFYCVLKKRGVHGIRISFFRYWKVKFAAKRMIVSIHDKFEHTFQDVELILKQNDSWQSNNKMVVGQIGILLQKIQECLFDITGVEFSVHIKLIYKLNNGGNVARTYIRVASHEEKRKTQGAFAEYRPRNQGKDGEEYFRIVSHNKNLKDIVRGASAYSLTEGQDTGLKCCSAFDYVIGENNHYFLSNNLIKDAARGFFYSSSNNYDKYYNSIGVFTINRHVPESHIADCNDIYGFLIVDSSKDSVFQDIFSSKLIGYFAHRLHNLFNSCKIMPIHPMNN